MFKKKLCVLLTAVLLITALSPMLVSADLGDTMWEEWEPNDYLDQANLIENDDTIVGVITGDDYDCYGFDLTSSSEIVLLCTSDCRHVIMGLADGNGNTIGAYESEQYEGYYHNLVYGTLEAGTYFIVLFSNGTTAECNYLLYLSHARASTPSTTPTTVTTTVPTTTTTVHQHSFTSKVVPPDCMSYGYTSHSCSTCGYSYTDNQGTEKGPHIFGSGGNMCDVCGVARAEAPIVIAYNDSTVILQETDGCEYSKDGISFQSSSLFTGLAPSKLYRFYQRIAAKDGLPAGQLSPATQVHTDPTPTTKETTTTTAASTTDTTDTTTTVVPTVVTLTHSDSGVSIRATDDVIDSDCVLRVYVLSQSKRYAQVYILLTKGDDILQPSGNVSVTLPIPKGVIGDTFRLSSTATDGSAVETEALFDNNALLFDTDTLGSFTIESIVPEGLGNVNSDGKINITDAVLLYYHVNGKTTLPDTTKAELTGDGKINIADAVTLYYYVNGKTDIL